MTDPTAQAGNGKSAAAPAPRDTFTNTTLQGIAFEQAQTMAAQAVMVRALEDALSLSPGDPVPPTVPVAVVQQVLQTQAAAVRTQLAYMQHLQDTATLLNVTPV